MNTITQTINSLGVALSGIIIQIINILPVILLAIIIAVLGWVFGGILGRAVAHLVSLLKIDSVLKSAGIDSVLHGVNFSVGRTLGGIVKWGIIVAFLMTATQLVGLDAFAGYLYQILNYIPNVIVAALILIASFVLADFVAKLVSGGAKAAGVKHGAASAIAKYAIILVGILAALSQLNIARDFMNILFMGIVAALALALGLAFGLGGRDAAADAIEDMKEGWNK